MVLEQSIFIFIWKSLQIDPGTGMVTVAFFFLLGCTEKICNWTWGNTRKHKETPGKLQGGEVCQEFKYAMCKESGFLLAQHFLTFNF